MHVIMHTILNHSLFSFSTTSLPAFFSPPYCTYKNILLYLSITFSLFSTFKNNIYNFKKDVHLPILGFLLNIAYISPTIYSISFWPHLLSHMTNILPLACYTPHTHLYNYNYISFPPIANAYPLLTLCISCITCHYHIFKDLDMLHFNRDKAH